MSGGLYDAAEISMDPRPTIATTAATVDLREGGACLFAHGSQGRAHGFDFAGT